MNRSVMAAVAVAACGAMGLSAAMAAPVSDWQMLYEADKTPAATDSVYLTRQSTAAPVTQFTESGTAGTSTAAGGEYTLDTRGTDNLHWFTLSSGQSPDFAPSSATGYTFEARLKLLGKDSIGNNAAVTFDFDEADATKYWALVLFESSPGTYQAISGGLIADIDAASFHTYRVTVKDTTLTFYVDGNLVGTSSAFSSIDTNALRFGDLTGENDGGVTVDYIRMNDMGAFAPVPEPASLSLLMLGGLALAGRRRKRS